MRLRRTTTAIAALALVASACGTGDTGETTTTEPPEETTTTEALEETTTSGAEETTTTGSTTVDFDDFALATNQVCHFSARHILVAEGDAGPANTALNDAGVETQVGWVDPLNEDISAPALVDGVEVLSVAEGSPNAFLLVEFLRSQGFFASPVRAIGMAGHWTFKAGHDPVPAENVTIEDPGPPQDETYIAVVDSGLVQPADEQFGWVLDGVSPGATGDNHPFEASHGTFIVSLIRQAAADLNISFAPVIAWPRELYQSWPEEAAEDVDTSAISDELWGSSGILAIIDLHTDDGRLSDYVPVALNLSWGTYNCDSNNPDMGVDALAGAIDAWMTTFSTPIYAAAGNEPPNHGPFYPAGYDDVVGVQALDSNGDPVVWDWDTDPPTTMSAQVDAADEYAPGCDLVGVGGGFALPDPVAWSGSSFATPLAALDALGLQTAEIQTASSPRC